MFPFDENTIVTGDALAILPKIPGDHVDLILTDPIWPDSKVKLPGSENAAEIFEYAARTFHLIAPRVIIHLGLKTDPRILAGLSQRMPFVQVCWLRWIPPRYYGPILVSADVAYVFGHRKLPADGSRVFGSEVDAVSGHAPPEDIRSSPDTHPTPRSLKHVSWLVRRFSRPGDLILDPFCGSGTTCLAAKLANRRYFGIEIDPKFADYARRRLSEADLFNPDRQTPKPCPEVSEKRSFGQ